MVSYRPRICWSGPSLQLRPLNGTIQASEEFKLHGGDTLPKNGHSLRRSEMAFSSPRDSAKDPSSIKTRQYTTTNLISYTVSVGSVTQDGDWNNELDCGRFHSVWSENILDEDLNYATVDRNSNSTQDIQRFQFENRNTRWRVVCI